MTTLPTPKQIKNFWKLVDTSGDCWLYTGKLNSYGYGVFKFTISKKIRKELRAHRLVWILTFGVIPYGLGVLHRCDTPKCCNPYHLFLGTQKDNMHDMFSKGRGNVLIGLSIARKIATSEETKKKRKITQIAIKFQQGSNHSQFGMFWIKHISQNISKKVSPEEIEKYLSSGWVRCRIKSW